MEAQLSSPRGDRLAGNLADDGAASDSASSHDRSPADASGGDPSPGTPEPKNPPRRDDHESDGVLRGTQRMEAYADAVFAIAFTLGVVEIEMPPGRAPLAEELAELAPSYFGFALGSFVIGIFWAHHHFSGAIYRTTGHWFNLATVVFLATIAFIAFPARVVADHFGDPETFPAAARLFAGSLAVVSAAWAVKWTIGMRMGHVDARLAPAYVRRLNATYLLSMTAMIAAAAISFVWPMTGLVLSVAIVGYYLLPPGTPDYREEAPIADGVD